MNGVKKKNAAVFMYGKMATDCIACYVNSVIL